MEVIVRASQGAALPHRLAFPGPYLYSFQAIDL